MKKSMHGDKKRISKNQTMILILVALALADCCGNTWIRDSQTAKGLTMSAIVEDERTITLGLINATQPTTVKEIQFSLTVALHRNLDATTTTGSVPPCPDASAGICCDHCTRYYVVSLYVNYQQSVEYQLFAPSNYILSPSPLNLDYLSVPPNYYATLWSQNGLLQCFCDKDAVSYSSLGDQMYSVAFPQGIQLNNGDSIQLVVSTEVSAQCESRQADGIQLVGTANFIYAYPGKIKH